MDIGCGWLLEWLVVVLFGLGSGEMGLGKREEEMGHVRFEGFVGE